MKRGIVMVSTLVLCLSGCGPSPQAGDGVAADRSASSDLLDGDTRPDGYQPTPGGKWRHRSCIHEVENGSFVDDDGNVTTPSGSTYHLPACGHRPWVDPKAKSHSLVSNPAFNGWYTFADRSASGSNYYTEIDATWHVPNEPKIQKDAILYFFNGLQNSGYIYQPVLEYNVNGNHNWTIASWKCNDGSDCTHSNRYAVSPGDTIHGDVIASSCDSNGVCSSVDVQTQGSGNPVTARLFSSGSRLNYATSAVLEAYNINNCDELPPNNQLKFFDIFLWNQDGRVTGSSIWAGHTPGACAESPNVANSEWVMLNWN